MSRDNRVLQCKGKNIFQYTKIQLNIYKMKYKDFVHILSEARIKKYKSATNGDKAKTIQLYHHNLKLSQRIFGVIGMFEVMLRNAIYMHYSHKFNDNCWLENQACLGKLLEHDIQLINSIKQTATSNGVCNPNKMVASLSFGFWTYLFTKRNYRIGGKTLLQIFPNKKKGLSQADIYKELTEIREFRNRIAHHEPVCFDKGPVISTKNARYIYGLIKEYIKYLGYDANKVLKIVEKPDRVLNEIERI